MVHVTNYLKISTQYGSIDTYSGDLIGQNNHTRKKTILKQGSRLLFLQTSSDLGGGGREGGKAINAHLI